MLLGNNKNGVRVLILAIGGPGAVYSAMEHMFDEHFSRHAPPGFDLWFLHGQNAFHRARRIVFGDINDCVIPGGLDKTLAALRVLKLEEYDFVVRTNLSSWFHWCGLRDFLLRQPRFGFAAGFSPDLSHLSGCNLMLSSDIAAKLTTADLIDRRLYDDVAISNWLRDFEAGVKWVWVSRIDLVYENSILVHGICDEAFHVRLKHDNRWHDVHLLHELTGLYDSRVSAWATVGRLDMNSILSSPVVDKKLIKRTLRMWRRNFNSALRRF